MWSVRHTFTKYVYIYFFGLVMVLQYFLYKHQFYWLWVIGLLSVGAYVLWGQNKDMVGKENVDFEQLEQKMAILLPSSASSASSAAVPSFLYVNLDLLEFLYEIRVLKIVDPKNFTDMLLRVNSLLQTAEQISDRQSASSEDLEKISLLKKEALNYFHSIVYSVTQPAEMAKHNQLRYILEEKLQHIYLDLLPYGKKGLTFQEFGYDAKKSTFDLY